MAHHGSGKFTANSFAIHSSEKVASKDLAQVLMNEVLRVGADVMIDRIPDSKSSRFQTGLDDIWGINVPCN